MITVADPTKLDYETSPAGHTYTVTAQASDGTLFNQQAFTIAVTDVPIGPPVDTNAAANSVVEGAANGTAVGLTASAIDPNGPATTYSLIGDTSGGGFTINASTGVVTVADSTKIDFETLAFNGRDSYSVTVQATNGAVTTSTVLRDRRDRRRTVDAGGFSNAAANIIAEGAANGSTVGVTASSTDVNGPGVTYSLTGDTSGGGFTINAATGVVTVADSTKIDYETAAGHAYSVTAQASDGTLSSSQTFTIGVSDVAPSTPVDANAAANAVAEGAANGSTVGITASSTDVNGPAVTYSLVGDTSGGGFTINAATGVITVADPTKIDYEFVARPCLYRHRAGQRRHADRVRRAFTIGVLDVAPSTPDRQRRDQQQRRRRRGQWLDRRRHGVFDRHQRTGGHLFADWRHLRRRLHHQCRDRRRHRRRFHQDRPRGFGLQRSRQLHRHRAGQRWHAVEFARHSASWSPRCRPRRLWIPMPTTSCSPAPRQPHRHRSRAPI